MNHIIEENTAVAKSVTDDDLAKRERRECCALYAGLAAQANPTLEFLYDGAGVYLRHAGRLLMLYSFAFTGEFVDLSDRPHDVTAYLKPETLVSASALEGRDE